MSGPGNLLRRHPMISFAVLACLFGWSIFLAAALGVGSAPDNMPLGPLFAALVVTAGQGRAELGSWGRRLRRWRVSPRWYAVAVLAPVALHVLDVLANTAFGAPLPTTAQLGGWTAIPANFLVMIVMVGIGEEAGWTAFAAPLLLRRHGFLGAYAVLAPLRILWHLPLLLSGQLDWVVWLVGNAGWQLLVLLIVTSRGGRWTHAAVWHTTLNVVGGGFLFQMVTGADHTRLGVLLGVTYAVAALAALVVATRRGRLDGRRMDDERPPDPVAAPDAESLMRMVAGR